MTSTDPGGAPREHDDHWQSHRRWLYLLAQLTVAVVVTLFLWRLMAVLSTVLMPAIVGLVLAYIFDPLIDAFEERGVPRTVAIAGFAVFLLVLVGVLLVVVLPAFVAQAATTVQKAPAWFESVYQELAALARDKLGYSGAEIEETVRRVLRSVQGTVLGVVATLGTSLSSVVSGVLVPLFFFYFLKDFDRLKVKPLAFVPPRWRPYVTSRAVTMDRVVGGWLRGQVQAAMVLSALYAIGLTIAGVKLGFVIGVVAGLLGFVPYFGAITGIVLSVLMVLIDQHGFRPLVGVAVTFAVVLSLDAYLITPRLVGAKVGMNPLLVIVVVFAGGSLFGLLGMMLAVPVTAAVSVLLVDALELYRSSEFFNRDAPPPALEAPAPASQEKPA
jgi:predicted PurR-regulated permease PerM